MKRPLKAREVAFILLPALGLGAFAWFQTRVEGVGGPRRSDGMYMASIEMHPAKGRFQAMGQSHEMKVTIGHSWPRPAWWDAPKNQTGVDALASNPRQWASPGLTKEQNLSYGAVLTSTVLQNGRPVLKTLWRDNQVGLPTPQNNQYVFPHEMPLDKIPASAGEVTFRGLYLIGAQEPIRVTRVVRKAGQILPQNCDRDPHARVVSTTAEAFYPLLSTANSVEDSTRVDFVVIRTETGLEHPRMFIDQLELRDARGKILKADTTPGFRSTGGGGASLENTDINISKPSIGLHLKPTLKTTNPLILSGKICVDDGWPMPFSVRLPPR